MLTRILSVDDPHAFLLALDLICKEQLVAFPTDTVYGLGALVRSSGAIEKLFVVKGRDSLKAIPVLLGDFSQIDQVVSTWSPKAKRLAECFWPGALTLVVPRQLDLPENLSPAATIGVRMPNHPAALRLLKSAGPLAVTSANISWGKNTTTAAQVYDQLGGQIALILDGGQTPGELASTVVDCSGGTLRILRQGSITLEMLQEALHGN